MLYILVLLIPFLAVIFFLVRQNKRLSDEYKGYYKRLWVVASTSTMQTAKQSESDLDVLITDDSIKDLEQDLFLLEKSFGIEKSSVVSNTFTPKKKKLQILSKRIKKLEAKANEGQNA